MLLYIYLLSINIKQILVQARISKCHIDFILQATDNITKLLFYLTFYVDMIKGCSQFERIRQNILCIRRLEANVSIWACSTAMTLRSIQTWHWNGLTACFQLSVCVCVCACRTQSGPTL